MWVQGERDSNAASLKPVEAALRRSHPSMTSVILPGAGHCAHQETPVAFDQAVTAFLDSEFPRD
jgi:pimeloyl-ACP methyl ester carboxylesterase